MSLITVGLPLRTIDGILGSFFDLTFDVHWLDRTSPR